PVVLLLLGVVCAGLWGYDALVTVRWVGSFPLKVRVVSKGKRRIVRISADTLPRKEQAELARIDPRYVEARLKRVEGFNGEPFTVEVKCRGAPWGLGGEGDYPQHQPLILNVEFDDGPMVGEAVKTPDGQSRRFGVFKGE